MFTSRFKDLVDSGFDCVTLSSSDECFLFVEHFSAEADEVIRLCFWTKSADTATLARADISWSL